MLLRLKVLLEKKLELVNEFPFKITKISPFPFSSPKIIAGLLESSTELIELQNVVKKIVKSFRINLEGKRYVPHVTLGRFKKRVPNFLDSQLGNIFLVDVIETVSIFESVLTKAGPIHSIIDEIYLNALSSSKK